MPKTYYEVLNVTPDANDDEIKKAYRKLAFHFHPDKAVVHGLDPKIAEESFKEVNTAHATLSDTELRRKYNLTLSTSRKASPAAATYSFSRRTASSVFKPSIYREKKSEPINPISYPNSLDKKWTDLIAADDVTQLDSNLKSMDAFKRDFLETLLYEACKNGKLNSVVYLIETRKINPRLRINDSLHFTGGIFKAAAESGNLDMVKYLLETHHVDIESQGLSAGTENTALSRAANRGHEAVVKYLISKGANVNPSVSNSNILNNAISSGNVRVVQLLIEAGTKIDSFSLDKAFKKGHLDIVQYILQRKPSISAHSFIDSPGIAAVFSGNVALVLYLEENEGLDIFVPDRSYHSRKETNLKLITAAGQSGSIDMMRYLLEDKRLLKEFKQDAPSEDYIYTALRSALSSSAGLYSERVPIQERVNLLRYLMEEHQLREPFMKFIKNDIRYRSIEEAAYLQSFIATTDERKRDLLLQIAESGLGKLSMEDLFRTYYLKIIKDNYNDFGSEIHYAIYKRRLSVEQIIECARVNEQFKLDAFFYYVSEDYKHELPVLDSLLGLDIDINTVNIEGNTALHVALRQAGYSDMVKYLIDKGADIYQKNAKGESVFDRLKTIPSFMEQIKKLGKAPEVTSTPLEKKPADLPKSHRSTRSSEDTQASSNKTNIKTKILSLLTQLAQYDDNAKHLFQTPAEVKDMVGIECNINFPVDIDTTKTQFIAIAAWFERELVSHYNTPGSSDLPSDLPRVVEATYKKPFFDLPGISPKHTLNFWPGGDELIQALNAILLKKQMKVPQVEKRAEASKQKSTEHTFFNNLKLLPLITKYNLPGSTQASLEKGLRKAANNGNVDDVRVFLKYVHNVNAVDPNPSSQKTALYWATLKGHTDCCELLLAAGAISAGHASDVDEYVDINLLSK